MNTSASDSYMNGIIKNILFLILFWVGNYFVLTSVYKEKSEWTFEHIMGAIGITTVLSVTIILLIFFVSILGLIFGAIATLASLFGLAYLTDKLVEILHTTTDKAELGISLLGILMSIITIIKLISNIRNYCLMRYGETHGYFSKE